MIRRLTILLLIVGCVFAKDGIKSANKKHSIGIGFGTNKSFNLIQYTYDFKLSKHISFFALAGLYNLAGLGLSWQSNYNSYIKNGDRLIITKTKNGRIKKVKLQAHHIPVIKDINV